MLVSIQSLHSVWMHLQTFSPKIHSKKATPKASHLASQLTALSIDSLLGA